jgi:hypothetical protein
MVSVLAVAFGAWERRDARPLLLHVAVVAALIVAYQLGVHPWIVGSMTPPGYAPDFHYPSLASALKILFTSHGFGVFLTMAAGQLAYFVVATFGMALAGLLFCARQTRGAPVDGTARDDGNERAVCVLLGLAPLGVIALGAIAFFQWDRFSGEFWIFGRYLDGAILPVLGIGLAVFRPDLRLGLASVFVVTVGLLLTAMVPAGVEHDISDTIAFWPQYVSRTAGFFAWMLLGALAVAAAARYGRPLVIAMMAVALVLSIYHQTLWHYWFLTDLSTPSPLVETIRSTVARGTCVGVNPALPADATLFQKTRHRLHAFYLFDYAYRRMSPAEWLEQCNGPYLTYDVPNVSELGSIRRIASDPASGLVLIQKAAN